MSYEFKKLGEVEALTEIPENANALVEVGGAIKRVPAAKGGGGELFIVNCLNADLDNGTCTFDKTFAETVAAYEAGQDVVFRATFGDGTVAMSVPMSILASDGVGGYSAIIAQGLVEASHTIIGMMADESGEIIMEDLPSADMGGVCMVNITFETEDLSTFTYSTKDKTYDEIKAAYDAGAMVYCKTTILHNGNAVNLEIIPLVMVSSVATGGSRNSFVFKCFYGHLMGKMFYIADDDTVASPYVD